MPGGRRRDRRRVHRGVDRWGGRDRQPERFELVVGFSAAINVSLNLLLIPRYGLNGAAAATALGSLVWNVLLSYFVYRRLGFYSVLGVYTLRKRG